MEDKSIADFEGNVCIMYIMTYFIITKKLKTVIDFNFMDVILYTFNLDCNSTHFEIRR